MPLNHDGAMAEVDRLAYERHRDRKSLRWVREEIEKLDFFNETQIDEAYKALDQAWAQSQSDLGGLLGDNTKATAHAAKSLDKCIQILDKVRATK